MLKKLCLYMLLIFSFINLSTKNSYAADFQNLTDKNFSYIFVPGIISTETQTAKYLPEFIGSSGETLVCKGGIHTLNQPISTCAFSDVMPQKLAEQSMNPWHYFTCWITARQNKKYGISVQRYPQQPGQDSATPQFVSPSAYTLEKHAFYLTKFNLAQEGDINALFKTYTEHIEKYPATNIVLYGVSRGAATICTFMGKHQPQNVKALILEAPFSSIPHLLRHSHKTTYPLLNKILPKVTSYNPDGDSPFKSIENISKEIPILIVGSDLDDLVPAQCPKRLMRKFAKLGHSKAHLLMLKKSTHSGYAFDDSADKTRYEAVVHAFYKHYGLPHDETLAAQGSEEWKKISGQSTLMPSA